jgi:hypothetical protein
MRFDLHVHSCFSKDSDSHPDSILKWAKTVGLDGLAICDHDTVEGGLTCARRAGELDCDILVIPGIEVSSAEGHVLVLGVKEVVPAGMSVPETIKYARKIGGTVIIPHPFKRTSHGIGYVEGLDIDAVEVLNSRCMTSSANIKAKQAAEKLGIPQVGGSDAHEPRMVGRSYTEIDAQEKTVEAVLLEIKNGNVRPGGRLTPPHYVVKQMFKGLKKKALTA